MLEINFLKREREELNGNLQETLDAEFSLGLDDKELKGITECDDEERQKILNSIFNLERRAEMLKHASKDRKNRPVKYYRVMDLKRLLNLLERGEQDASFDGDYPVDISILKYFLYSIYENMVGSKSSERLQNFRKKSVEDQLVLLFPEVQVDELKELLSQNSTNAFKIFFDQHVDNNVKVQRHGGGITLQYSNFLSFSVGGPVFSRDVFFGDVENRAVCVEAIFPDDQIKTRFNYDRAIEGEKEVLVKRIKLSNISRICATYGQYVDEFIEGEDSNIAQFAKQNPNNFHVKADMPVEGWRWDEKIDDYLPVGVLPGVNRRLK